MKVGIIKNQKDKHLNHKNLYCIKTLIDDIIIASEIKTGGSEH